MTIPGLLFLAMAPTISVAPMKKALDYDRVVECLIAVEGTSWDRPGGALGFTRKAWVEDGGLHPYSNACLRRIAVPAAKRRLHRFSVWLASRGYSVTVERLGQAWRHGLAGSVGAYKLSKDLDYGQRVANLYEDESFRP